MNPLKDWSSSLPLRDNNYTYNTLLHGTDYIYDGPYQITNERTFRLTLDLWRSWSLMA